LGQALGYVWGGSRHRRHLRGRSRQGCGARRGFDSLQGDEGQQRRRWRSGGQNGSLNGFGLLGRRLGGFALKFGRRFRRRFGQRGRSGGTERWRWQRHGRAFQLHAQHRRFGAALLPGQAQAGQAVAIPKLQAEQQGMQDEGEQERASEPPRRRAQVPEAPRVPALKAGEVSRLLRRI
jgi:hypothetical protein